MAKQMRTAKGQHQAGTFTTRAKQHRAMVAKAMPFAPAPTATKSSGATNGRRTTGSSRGAATPGGALAR